MFDKKLFFLIALFPFLIYSQKGETINHIYEGNKEADLEKYSKDIKSISSDWNDFSHESW